ncbi:MAG: hypothetical protein LBG47_10690 [Prevotellaceae bacterium]|nr:hypothetical protein [Prevotellaceae bacterium]
MKQHLWILAGAAFLAACGAGSEKQEQSVDFGDIPPQQLRDGFLQLRATASSGLPVSYASWDTAVAAIDGSKVLFRQAGVVDIIAAQPGNERFYEAPSVTRRLIIRDWDPDKKTQEISFDLPAEWKLSRDGTIVALKAEASSGLPVGFALSTTKYGFLLSRSPNRYLYLYHAGEGGQLVGAERLSYDAQISVVASQAGNDEYNPADNVEKMMHVIGDVMH